MGNDLINSSTFTVFMILAVLWTLPWKGVALWRSARNGQKIWFCLMLVINTLAILEIIYIFFFSKKIEPEKQENYYRG